jgi:carbonic anhydrase
LHEVARRDEIAASSLNYSFIRMRNAAPRSTPQVPQFGSAVDGATYQLRPGGYAVIFNTAGDVAVVETPSGHMLPGGGQLDGESAEEAALREVEEECGLRVSLGARIGVADELVFAADEQTHYRKRCTFFLATVIATTERGETDHVLQWLAQQDAASRLRHESQRRAVTQAIALRYCAAEPPAEPAGGGAGRPGPDEALRILMEGNERFAAGRSANPRRSPADFQQLAEGQAPFVVIVSCADSRVAPEILFDVGKGDAFVVRVAGNVIGGAGAVVKGSIEYAVAELDVSLIVVLGHSNCGAVKAAIKHIEAKDSLPGAINGLVELIKPAVAQSNAESGDPLENAIRKNVALGVERLKGLEPMLAPRVTAGKLRIVGGVYNLRSGKVTLVA